MGFIAEMLSLGLVITFITSPLNLTATTLLRLEAKSTGHYVSKELLLLFGRIGVLFPCEFGHARVRHFLLEGGECGSAGFFLRVLLKHKRMTLRPEPFCPI